MPSRAKSHHSVRYSEPAIKPAAGVSPADPLAGKLVVRLKDAFEIIGCGHTKGYDLIADGRLKVTKIDRMTLVYTESIRQLLGLSPTQALPPAPRARSAERRAARLSAAAP